MTKNKLLTYGVLVLIGILLIAAIRGCQKANQAISAQDKAVSFGDSIKAAFNIYKVITDSSSKRFEDSLEFERGQRALANEQRLRTEAQLQDITKENRALIEKHKLAKYTDTSAVLVPGEYLTDCEGCFTKLETTTALANKYKGDVNNLQSQWEKQNQLYQKRFKELDQEKLGFYNKINTLAKAQQEAVDKLKPHGRLYLTWGVLWHYLPTAAGAGLMYQNKRNLIWGITCYYGQNGTTIETNIHFPLSLKFK